MLASSFTLVQVDYLVVVHRNVGVGQDEVTTERSFGRGRVRTEIRSRSPNRSRELVKRLTDRLV